MTMTHEIKELAFSNSLDYVGIAAADSLENEPEGSRPSDFLPDAQTIVSLGVKLSLGVQFANRLAHSRRDLRHAIYSYLWHGFGLPSLHYLDRTAILIIRFLEKQGYIAVPAMAASSFDIRSSLTEFSNIRAAVAAGLGDLGWGELVLTPDAGPRARFTSIITNAPLDVDAVPTKSNLCEPDKCKELGKGLPVCARVCPTHAIGPGEQETRIGDKIFRTAKIDRWRCMWGSMGLSKDSLGLKDIPMPDTVGPEEVFNGMKERDPAQSLELMVISRGDYCGKCIMECPVASSSKVNELLLKAKRKSRGKECGQKIGHGKK
jgi:epoxyqueuosine reductase